MATAQTITLDLLKGKALDEFDGMVAMSFGDGTSIPIAANTSLDNELFRGGFEPGKTTKDLGLGTYEFERRVPLTKLIGIEVSEYAIFDNEISGGNMALRELFPEAFLKTGDEEIITTTRVTVEVINN